MIIIHIFTITLPDRGSEFEKYELFENNYGKQMK